MILPTENLTKKDLDRFYGVRYKGKIVSYISPMLAKSRRITVESLKKLKDVHRKILKVFDKISLEDDVKVLHDLADKITDFDYELQELWGFEKDSRFHTWWYRSPKCSCPKLDNQDRIGTSYRIISEKCPLHNSIPV